MAEKRLTLQAAGILPKAAGQTPAAIRVEGMTDSYEIGYPHFKSHYDKALINKPSRLQGKQGMIIQAAAEHPDANIVLDASQLNAQGGGIDLKAYSSILLESGDNNVYTFRRTKSKHGNFIRKTKFNYNTNHMIMPAPVELNAGGNINLQAGKDIDAYTTRFYTPQGRTTLIAGEELNLLAEQGIHEHKLKTQKNSRFIGIKIKNKNYSRKELTETRLPVKVIAQGANTLSGWNTVLEGTDFSTGLQGAVIQAGVGDKARADAKIILKGIKTTVSTEEKSNSKSAVWQSMAGKGSTVETLQLPKFEGPAAPVLSAPGGYIVDIPKGNLKTEIEKLAKQPEYAYLKQLQVAKNVNWNQVQLAYDKWDYKQEGLTGAGAAIIALAVTVVTSGAGTGAALGLNGAAAAATDAAFASLASQASVSLINNKGDVGKTLKELGRSSTVKNLVVAAATAGVADKIGASALNNVSDKQWVNNLTVNLANAGSAALINTAVNGGSLKDNLEANILAALVNTAHGEAASKIKQLDHHYIAHKIAHAVAGCAAAAANKGKCQDGAIGAAVGEILGEALLSDTDLGRLNPTERAKIEAKIIAKAKLVAGTVAAMSKGDVNTAANAAQIAVKNNSLNRLDGLTPDERRQEEIKKRYGTDIGEISKQLSQGRITLTKDLADYIYKLNNNPKLLIEVNSDGWNVYVDKNAQWKTNPVNKQEVFTSGRIPYSDVSRWAVHGNVSVIKGKDGKYRLATEQYNFEMHKFNGGVKSNAKTLYRNVETVIGSPGQGTPFEIKFKGNVNVVN